MLPDKVIVTLADGSVVTVTAHQQDETDPRGTVRVAEENLEREYAAPDAAELGQALGDMARRAQGAVV